MQKQPLRFTNPTTTKNFPKDAVGNDTLTVAELENAAREWLFDCQYRQHSHRTIGNRRMIVDKLIWFLNQHGHAHCGVSELRRFFAYLTTGHEDEGGRWGNASKCNSSYKLVRPRTVTSPHRTYLPQPYSEFLQLACR